MKVMTSLVHEYEGTRDFVRVTGLSCVNISFFIQADLADFSSECRIRGFCVECAVNVAINVALLTRTLIKSKSEVKKVNSYRKLYNALALRCGQITALKPI